ncbi:MAG: GTP-binding protein, partial [Candidatus Paceibacterota bacterium]
VVSAEEGVKTQTIEAHKAIKNSGIPFIVAINKIDKPEANVERIKTNLLENEIYLEGMGGEVPWVPISAKTGEGIPDLLDLMLLVADMAELSGDIHKKATGIVLESHRDTQKGISASLLIKDGSIKKGDYVWAGNALSPVRIMQDCNGKNITEASFSSPINIIGFNNLPQSGETFEVVDSKKEAEQAVLEYCTLTGGDTKEAVVMTPPNEDITSIPIILRADVQGSLEAIEHEIEKMPLERAEVKVVQKNVGNVSESDIKVALGNQNTRVVAFNVSTDNAARDFAARNDITIHSFDIIYKLAEWLAEEVKKMTPEIDVEESTGSAVLLKVFSKNKEKQVVGGKVAVGSLSVGNVVNIMRRENKIGTGVITNLQQQKADSKTVEAGNEFGAQVDSRVEIAPRDVIESFIIVKK